MSSNQQSVERRAFWGTFALCFAVPLALQLLLHADFYFTRAVQDGGDFAANALQIRNAKTFQEIHGNYSRWNFNHPGPAFFYVYAWGELLFHDWLRVSPAPHNAHALALLLFQCGLFALSIALARRLVRHTAFAPLALALGLIHFGLTGHAFVSLWPPHQFLMAFVLMLVSAAAVVAGDRRALPFLVLACCLCVHAHVAQPLFVIPIFAGALAVAVWRQGARAALFDRSAVISLGLIAAFVWPLVIDALGAESNLELILDHLRRHRGGGYSTSASLSYLLLFFTYWGFHDVPSGTPPGTFLIRHAGWFLGWAAVLAAAASPFGRQTLEPPGNPSRAFRRALWAVFGACLLITLQWGRMIDGEMWAFNAFFNYGILFLPALLVAERTARRIPLALQRHAWWAVVPAAAGVFVLSNPVLSDIRLPPIDARAVVAAALPEPVPEGGVVAIQFAHGQWPQAVALALQLERAGINWCVDDEWAVMFGRKRTLRSVGRGQPLVELAALPSSPGETGPTTFHGVTYSAVRADLDPDGFPKTLGPTAPPFRFSDGLHEPESDFVWSAGGRTVLKLQLRPAKSAVRMRLDLEPMTHPERRKEQRFTVSLGQHALGVFALRRREQLAIEIPKDVWNRAAEARHAALTFDWQDAASPKELGLSDDPRTLAVAFRGISFFRAEDPAGSGEGPR
jgi:hypothetical protein